MFDIDDLGPCSDHDLAIVNLWEIFEMRYLRAYASDPLQNSTACVPSPFLTLEFEEKIICNYVTFNK